MVDDRDEQYDGQEEEEYHFSDDQVNYEVEADTQKVANVSATSSKVSNIKELIFTKLAQHRRIVIGVVTFIVLIGVIYKIVAPSSSPPTTDFTQSTVTAGAPVTAEAQKSAVSVAGQSVPSVSQPTSGTSQLTPSASQPVSGVPQPVPSAVQPASLASQSNQPTSLPPQSASPVLQSVPPQPGAPQLAQQTLSNQQAQTVPGVQQAAGMVSPVVTSQPMPVNNGSVSSGMIGNTAQMPQETVPSSAAPMQTMQSPSAQPVQSVQATMMPSAGGVVQPITQQMPALPVQPMDAQTKNMTDRLASLEQQNAAIMNLLQTEYAQKMSDYETQTTATRGKLEEVTKRLNRMETAINQISQILQGGGGRQMSSGMMGALPTEVPAKMIEPKTVYAVQAIIPGRAWLKSESGDTVTVAEGDVLRGYGRVTKIDPYDGIVSIDTGNRVITLSYGMNAE